MGKKVTGNPKKVIYYKEKKINLHFIAFFYCNILAKKIQKKVKKGQKWPNNLFSRSLEIILFDIE